ncbi:MAG: PQQ-dependent sugar dehydrogenase [Chitinophagaceae bacterium]
MKKFSFLLYVTLIVCGSIQAQTLPPGFAAVPVTTGWDNPVGVTFTSDGMKMFVWERGGKVFVLNRDGSGNYIKQATPVLNIVEEVGNYDAYGMLGLALDPNYSTNGLIYLLYVVDRHHLIFFGTPDYNAGTDDFGRATIGRVTRYQTNTSGTIVANTASRTILIGETKSTGMPIIHLSHGTGSLAFASDGTLLVSIGDASNYDGMDIGSNPGTSYVQALQDGIIRPAENVGAYRSQMINSLSGKLLRIDPQTGNGIPSNPFYSAGEPRAAKSRVWALGLRNSCRFALKPGTGSTDPSLGDIGEIFAGDVGWGTWEDLNIIKAPGQNFGWPIFEGLELAPEDYATLNIENQDEPNPLFGINGCNQQYLRFKDLIKEATADGNKTIFNPCNPAVAIGTGNRYVHARPALDWSHAHPWARRGIFNGNNAAVAMVGTPESGVVGTPFNGNCSLGGVYYTGDAYPAGYKNTYFQMDFGAQWIKRFTIDFTDVVTRVDNFASNCLDMVCMAQNPVDGLIYTVQMTSNGVKKIQFGGNIPPIVTMTSDKKYGPGPLTVQFNGGASSDPDGTISTYSWNFGDATTSTQTNPSHIFTGTAGVPKKFVVKLTVTDNGGATAVDSIIISINNTPPVVNITSPVKNSTYTPGTDTLYAETAVVTDAEHTTGQLKYEWQSILRHNNHQHNEVIDTNKVTNARIQRVGCSGDSYYWLINLKVTDAAGLSTMDSTKLFPGCAGTTGTLQGSVVLMGRTAPPSTQWVVPLHIDLYANGNNTVPVYSYDVVTDQNGNFTINDVPVGSYTMTLKNSHTTRKVKTAQSIISGNNVISFGTLPEGDTDNNNVINFTDILVVLSSYNKLTGNPGYNDNTDLNRDGAVSFNDIILLLSSFNTLGENP